MIVAMFIYLFDFQVKVNSHTMIEIEDSQSLIGTEIFLSFYSLPT